MTEPFTNDKSYDTHRREARFLLPADSTRRQFLASSALAAGTALLPLGRVAEAKTPESARVRVAWVGHGTRLEADTPYLLSAARSKLVKVVAISEATQERRELCQEIVSFETGKKPDAFEDVAALLEGGKVDAVLCAVPAGESLSVFRSSVEAGVHCFGTFPQSWGPQELQQLAAHQARHPEVKVQFSSPWRHQLRYREAARLVREDQVLGKLTGCKHRLVPRGGAGSVSWVFPGCDLVTWFTGRWPLRARPDSDPSSPVVLEYSDGFTVRFWRGATTFHGTLGDMDATSGKISYRGPVVGTRHVEGTLLWQPRPERRELRDFFETVAFDRTPLVSTGQIRDSLLVSLLARKAHEEQRTVTWKEITA